MKKLKHLYKYKSLNSISDLSRVLSIINESKIYMPTYDQLNDPLEGAGYNIILSPWAGIQTFSTADVELPPIEKVKNKFRILSLSIDPISPQLWAHYANNYNGICLCFSMDGVFGEAKEVLYRQKDEKKALTNEELEIAVYEGLFYKQRDWSYEKEWRIVRRMKRNKYLHFNPEDLVAVIIGAKTPTEIAQIIVKSIRENIKVFKAVPGYRTASIHLLDWNYEVVFDGVPIEYITSIEDELSK